MSTDSSYNEIINQNSRYEQLLRGEIGGEDIKLIFVDSSSDSDGGVVDDGKPPKRRSKIRYKRGGVVNPPKKNCREIMAHKAFLHSCGFITAAFTENRFAEGESGEITINVPPGTYGAVDALMRWCYDSRCQFDTDQVASERYEYVKGIPALWVLADFMQCQELCDAIIDVLKKGKILRTGMSFAVLVDEVYELGAAASSHVLLGAAIEGVPLDKTKTKREGLETLLDFGGDKMLNALAMVRGNSDGNSGDNDGDDVILVTLGEYLAEMKREDRAKLLPSFFARCLAKFPPATLPEANYANMVIDYITDREESGHKLSDPCVMAFLGTVDFGSISRDALKHSFIPRVEKLSPAYALVLNDFPGSSPLVTRLTRCGFSMERITPRPPRSWGPSNGVVVLSCGNILSEKSFTSLTDKSSRDVTIFRCPFCRKIDPNRSEGIRAHWLKHTELRDNRGFRRGEVCNEYYDYTSFPDKSGDVDNLIEDDIELTFEEHESSRLFFDRKRTKSAALMHWVTSQGDSEDENATSERTQKRSRSDNPSLLQSNGAFVRVLNQCSEIESEKVFVHSIGSAGWRIERTINAFAKSLTTIPADRVNHATQGIGFFRYVPDALYSLGERLAPDAKWNDIGFRLRGSDEELIVARRLWNAGKPVIRIYSDVAIANMEVTVQLQDIMVDALTYPLAIVDEKDEESATHSWTVDVLPRETTRDHSSILRHKRDGNATSREYSYLFWEASATKEFHINMSNASCVRSTELSSGLLQDALLAQGLSTDEATEMATHWLPYLTKKKFVVIEFLPTKEIDKMAKLRVNPVPAQIHRVFILFRPTDVDHSGSIPLVRSPALVLPREGCTVVEWGGMECF